MFPDVPKVKHHLRLGSRHQKALNTQLIDKLSTELAELRHRIEELEKKDEEKKKRIYKYKTARN